MKATITKYGIWGCLIAAAAMATGLSGCSAVVDEPRQEEPAPAPSGKMFNMAFHIGQGEGARSDSQGHPENPGYEPDMYENAINLNDIALYIFADDRLVYRSDDPAAQDDFFSITGASGAGYTVNLKVSADRLEVDPNSHDRIALRVLALANMNTASSLASFDYPQQPYDASYSQVLGNLASATFQLPAAWDPANLDTPASPDPGRYIPLFGTRTLSVDPAELYHTESWNTLFLGNVMMLRAVAKVELLDGIEDRDEDGFPRVVDAWLSYGIPAGRLLPADAANYQNGTQVHAVNLAAQGALQTREMRCINAGIPDNPAVMRFFRAYCPEQSISSEQPVIRLLVQPAAGSSESDYIEYTVPLEGYNGNPFGFVNLYRNHIYRINVKSVNIGTPAQITVNVLDWDDEEVIWDYSDNPGLSTGGEIEWVAGTYQGQVNRTDATVVTRQDLKPLECHFTLASPINATWRALLVPAGGDPNAFRFLDADGNQVESVTGVIDGSQISLSITATDPTPQVQNRARLQIIVTTPDGRSMTADVLNGQYGSNKYFTIIQNQQF